MASLNQVNIIGNLGKDPEIRNGKETQVSKLSVATQEYKGKGKDAETTWHIVTLFGNAAKYANANLRKGDLVLVQGAIKNSKWTDKEGTERYSTEIIAESIQGLNLKEKGRKGAEDHSTAGTM